MNYFFLVASLVLYYFSDGAHGIKSSDFCHLVETECVGRYDSDSYKTVCGIQKCHSPLDYECERNLNLTLQFLFYLCILFELKKVKKAFFAPKAKKSADYI